ncbi:putative CDK-activating kinase assembly factor MAT1 [Planoprotostelium fungivorum]|uniref:Putative CDK-activating kinase assembly factor MAT1 n=1 Tax=Planoprotostelium fungivorum TaxID=1890364 RepID=A0A2P6N259_9EUKA|nr:putative CDK-activating kinase assembly factor MAT1 [Planoprotostelium fungivorum]
MSSAECSLCKSELLLNPNMKLLTASCDSCVSRSITVGKVNFPRNCRLLTPEGHCLPTLQSNPKKEQLYDEVSRRCRIRERDDNQKDDIERVSSNVEIANQNYSFNMRRDDFGSVRAYNDYLEEVEDIIHNLTNNVEHEATQERIKKYRRENQSRIVINQSKKAEFEREMHARVIQQEREAEDKRRENAAEDQRVQQERIKEREEKIDGMPKSSKKEEKKDNGQNKKTIPATNAPKPPLTYVPTQMTGFLPQSFSFRTQKQTTQAGEQMSEEQRMRRTMKAGGWQDEFITKKAMEDAFNSLVF